MAGCSMENTERYSAAPYTPALPFLWEAPTSELLSPSLLLPCPQHPHSQLQAGLQCCSQGEGSSKSCQKVVCLLPISKFHQQKSQWNGTGSWQSVAINHKVLIAILLLRGFYYIEMHMYRTYEHIHTQRICYSVV